MAPSSLEPHKQKSKSRSSRQKKKGAEFLVEVREEANVLRHVKDSRV